MHAEKEFLPLRSLVCMPLNSLHVRWKVSDGVIADRPGFTPDSASWRGQSVVSAAQFDAPSLEFLFGVADQLRSLLEEPQPAEISAAGPRGSAPLRLLEGRVVACLFLEPSTRTSCSFVAAAQRLGGHAILLNEQVDYFLTFRVQWNCARSLRGFLLISVA
jgi:hypothetical protein